MISGGPAKRDREEHLVDSSKRAKLAFNEEYPQDTLRTCTAGSVKRVRDEGMLTRSKRRKVADGDERKTYVLSSDEEASERDEPAAKVCKRHRSQSQTAGDSRAVSEQATSASQQVRANYFLHLGLSQSM